MSLRFKRLGDDRLVKKKKLMVFISTGDTCRAPMAAGYFKKLLDEHGNLEIEIRDAGIMTVAGLRATPEAIQVLDTVDVDLRKHTSRKLSNETIKRADLIVGMSSFHVQTALRQSELAKGKTYLLKEYIGWEHKNVQISDPMGGTLEVYKKCFQEIKESCDRLISHDFILGKAAEPRPIPPPASPAKAKGVKSGDKKKSKEGVPEKAEPAAEKSAAPKPAAKAKSEEAPHTAPASSATAPAPKKKPEPPKKAEPVIRKVEAAKKPEPAKKPELAKKAEPAKKVEPAKKMEPAKKSEAKHGAAKR